jgi:hypothetical protein
MTSWEPLRASRLDEGVLKLSGVLNSGVSYAGDDEREIPGVMQPAGASARQHGRLKY